MLHHGSRHILAIAAVCILAEYVADGLQQPVIADQHSADHRIGTGPNAGAGSNQLQEVILRHNSTDDRPQPGRDLGYSCQRVRLTVVGALWAERSAQRAHDVE